MMDRQMDRISLVDDLLDISRIAHGTLELRARRSISATRLRMPPKRFARSSMTGD